MRVALIVELITSKQGFLFNKKSPAPKVAINENLNTIYIITQSLLV